MQCMYCLWASPYITTSTTASCVEVLRVYTQHAVISRYILLVSRDDVSVCIYPLSDLFDLLVFSTNTLTRYM